MNNSQGSTPAKPAAPRAHKGYRSRRPRPKVKQPVPQNKPSVSVIPLGGVGEVGKNMTVIEYGDDIVVIDAGVKFPGEELLGIDLVIPDITYLVENVSKIRGIFLTHGHEDHIGALPFVLRQIQVPIYGTRLTLGLVKNKLTEHGLMRDAQLHEITADDIINVGSLELEFFRVNHSIPDGIGIAVRTPVGLIVHSGDFKLDQTPVDDKVLEFSKLARYGDEGVLLFICDSTNVERPGYTPSERTVGDTFRSVFAKTQSRIIIATFASNVHRIQQVINTAAEFNRKVAVVGRSMVTVVDVAQQLGYLTVPKGMLVETEEVDRLPDNQVTIITTGSQGEPMAALTRMATNNHRQIAIREGDTVIISATPIPGNEKLVARTIDNLFRIGADVVYKDVAMVHVSGHAAQQEIKLMLNLLRPKYAIPFHGEYRHQTTFSKLAQTMGIPADHIIRCNIGDRIEFNAEQGQITGSVEAGAVMVDGIGVGDVGNIVLRDRHHLAQDGVVIAVVTIDKENGTILAGPDLVSRGFVFVREAGDLLGEAKSKVREALTTRTAANTTEWSILKNLIRDTLNEYFYLKTKRRPIVLPIIMEI
ncbi:ribonuclease J [Heliophilum fasciatum]|uniref:Ribonuclease J n=1 Tax=Heliophilum fasciatum TaxID=35700 RepID=A0A4V2SWV0_9FIRM|nr:ribonuclease J [Heliophilum fasciatum]MCW2278551.1 ribonuclease J [Heliophilum fasciatum]TCP63506.1 ribonuclease J [Heliophilum fasciatum]